MQNITVQPQNSISNVNSKDKKVKKSFFKKNELKSDTAELSSKSEKSNNTKKKVAIGAAIAMAAAAVAAACCIIGRNPAKSAKVLKGTSKLDDEVFKKGKSMADDIVTKHNSDYKKLLDKLGKTDSAKDAIQKCPQELLPKDMIFYHGTKKPKGIYKNGFSPYASKQVEKSARELGAGVYVTPDSKVAAGFSGVFGKIIPVKVNPEKVALATEDSQRSFMRGISEIISKEYTQEAYDALPKKERAAMMEMLTSRVYKDLGYDAVYSSGSLNKAGGLSAIFSPDINKMLGRNQSQLVVLNPEKMEIVSRSLKDRIKDVPSKFKSMFNQLSYSLQHPYGF